MISTADVTFREERTDDVETRQGVILSIRVYGSMWSIGFTPNGSYTSRIYRNISSELLSSCPFRNFTLLEWSICLSADILTCYRCYYFGYSLFSTASVLATYYTDYLYTKKSKHQFQKVHLLLSFQNFLIRKTLKFKIFKLHIWQFYWSL